MGRFKGGLRCKGGVNTVVINVITEINYRCNYMKVFFFKYKNNVKTICVIGFLTEKFKVSRGLVSSSPECFFKSP